MSSPSGEPPLPPGKKMSAASDPTPPQYQRLGYTRADQVSTCELLSKIAGLEEELRQADEDNALMAVQLADVKAEKTSLQMQVQQLLAQLQEMQSRVVRGAEQTATLLAQATSPEHAELLKKIAQLEAERQASRDAERTLQIQLQATRVGTMKLSEEVQRLLTQLNDEQIAHQQQLSVAQTTQVQCGKAVEAMVKHLNTVKQHSNEILQHNEMLQEELSNATCRIDELEGILSQHCIPIPIDRDQMHRDAHALGIELHDEVLPGNGTTTTTSSQS